MNNRNSAHDVDDVFKDSFGNGDERKASEGQAADMTEAEINKDDFAKEYPSELSSITSTMSLAHSGTPPYTALLVPSASNVPENTDGRDVAHGVVTGRKKLEHAAPGEPISPSGLGTEASLERPLAVFASNDNHDDAPGAFPIFPSSHNTATSRTFRSSISSYDSTRDFSNEEFKQGEGVPNSTGSNIGERARSLYAVEAQLVPDGNEGGSTIVAEAKSVTLKCYQRPLSRWIFVGSILLGCVSLARWLYLSFDQNLRLAVRH